MNFGKYFIQDIDLINPTFNGFLNFVLRRFKGDDRTRLRVFLDDVTQESVSDDELQRLWNATQADIYFRTGADLRAMLKTARDRL